MGFGRISSGLMSDQSVNFLNNNLQTLASLQKKLSSNQNINTPSDDPVGLTRLLDLSNNINMDNRYVSNVQDAKNETSTADSALSSITNLIQRAQELTTQAANFTTNQDGKNAIALEIDQIVNQLVQIGNTNISGKYIFSGFKTDVPPFSRTADDISYNGTPTTQSWQRNVQISDGISLPMNINGDNLLGQVQVSAAGPPLPPTFAAGSHGLFQTLIELKQDLQAAGDPNQNSEISKRLDDLTNDLNTVSSNQAVIGAIANRLNLTQTRLDDRKAILTQQYAGIQDINMPSVIADLNQQQNIFQASLSVTGKLLQETLLNFLR